MSTKKTLNSVINNTVQISSKDLERCAAWASSISIDELDSGISSGIQFQKAIGKSEQECAKYIYRNFKKELSGIITFNQEMGIDFQ
jgi:hypothetical protein